MDNEKPDTINSIPSSNASDEEPKRIPGSEKLALIARELKEGKQPESVTVRTLLDWFGYYRRGSFGVVYINDRLKEAGITTDPDFRNVWLDARVTFVPIQPFKEAEAGHLTALNRRPRR